MPPLRAAIAVCLLSACIAAPHPAAAQDEQEQSDRNLIQKVGDLFKADPARKAERQRRRQDRRDAKQLEKELEVSGDTVYYKGVNIDQALDATDRDLERKYKQLRKIEEQDPKKVDPAKTILLQQEILELENSKRQLANIRGSALGIESTEAEHDLEESSLERERMDRSIGNVRGLERSFAEHLSNSPEDRGAGGGAGGGLAAGGNTGPAGGGFSPGGPSGDPSNPSSRKELLLASNAGFKASFDKHGLKVGAGPGGRPAIVDKSGVPASEQQIQSLRSQVQSDPQALMKRPDFFEVLPRKKFESLKSVYKKDPSLQGAEFRHVALTPTDRDFQWSQSCTRLSGGCNPNTRQVSYQRGQFVAPEDLGRIGNTIARDHEQYADSEDFSWGDLDEDLETTRAKRDLSGSFGGAGERRSFIGSVLGKLVSFKAQLLGTDPQAARAAGKEAPQAGALPITAPTAGRTPAAAQKNRIPETIPAAPATAQTDEKQNSPPFWALSLAAGGLLILFGLKQRNG